MRQQATTARRCSARRLRTLRLRRGSCGRRWPPQRGAACSGKARGHRRPASVLSRHGSHTRPPVWFRALASIAAPSLPRAEVWHADLASVACTEGRALVLMGDREGAIAKLREALASEPWLRANAEAAKDAAGLLQNLVGAAGVGGPAGGSGAAGRRTGGK